MCDRANYMLLCFRYLFHNLILKTKIPSAMKSIFFIGIIYFCLCITCQGQKLYSLENLQQSSQTQLNTYLALAQKQKKTGSIIKTTGLITIGAGVLVTSISNHDEWIVSTGEAVGAVMILIGTGATLVGLPIQLTGSSRIKRINSVMAQSSGSLNLELSPYSLRSNIAQQNLYGVTIRIRF